MTPPKAAYRLSGSAFRDLQEIEAYIAVDNPTAAEKVIDSIEATCAMLVRERFDPQLQ